MIGSATLRSEAATTADWCTFGNSRVWNRCEAAARCGLAAALASVVVLQPATAAVLPLAAPLAAILAVIAVQNTLGATIGFTVTAVRAAAAVALPCSLVALTAPATPAVFWIAAVLILVPVHYLSEYPAKKLVLAFGVLALYIRWKSDGEREWYIGFSVLSTLLAACACAVAAVVLPFPRTGWAVADRRRRNASALVAQVYSELVTSLVCASGYEQVLADSAVHLDVLTDLIPALRTAAASAEWESRVWVAARSAAAVATVVPAFCFERTSMHEYHKLAADVGALTRLTKTLETISLRVGDVNAARLRSEDNHAAQLKYFRDPLLALDRGVSGVLSGSCDAAAVRDALRAMDDATLSCRTELIYKAKRNVSPEDKLSLKMVVWHVRRLAEVLLEAQDASGRLEATAWTPFRDVFLAPLLWFADALADRGAKGLKGLNRLAQCEKDHELFESLKTVAALLVAIAASEGFGWTPSFWAGLTVAFISSPTASGSLATSLNRVLGTVFGSAYGYIVMRSFSPEPWGLGVMFSVWCVAAGYVRAGAPRYAYSGVVAQLTAAIVLFDFDLNEQQSSFGHASVEHFAFQRIQQTIFAAFVYLVLVYSIDPVRPSATVRGGVRLTLTSLNHVLHALLDAFAASAAGDGRAKASAVEGLLAEVVQAVETQVKSLPETVDEIDLWRPAFPTDGFKGLLAEEVGASTAVSEAVRASATFARPSPEFAKLLVPVAKECSALADAFDAVLNTLVVVADAKNSNIYADDLTHGVDSLQRSSAAVMASFYATMNSHIQAVEVPGTTNDEVEAYSLFVQSVRDVTNHVVALSRALRAFKVKEHAQRYRLV
eukprot:TRINITY_DN24838_c0_g1_i1.p1 TRINITY_DN24838_c0_g1~~TRINITY_DN24838_c0_g1_i1.p1  ORF type:complete len:834 (+),score=238.13 TRINITY_DN24838_c0_g1_i1:86-2587(+)